VQIEARSTLESDIDGDREVDSQDLLEFLRRWPARKAFNQNRGVGLQAEESETGDPESLEDQGNRRMEEEAAENADIFPGDPSGLFYPVEGKKGFHDPTPEDLKVIRRRPVLIKFELLEAAFLGERRDITFNVFEDVSLQGAVERVITRSDARYSLVGFIGGDAASPFILTVNDGIIAGNIRTSRGDFYQVRFTPPGHYETREIHEARFPECGVRQGFPASPINLKGTGGAGTCVQGAYDDGTAYNVLVVYTADARSAAGGTTAMETLIDLAIVETNTIYENSEIDLEVNLVHTQEVDYDEGTTSGDFSQSLTDLKGKTDGEMDEVHQLRDYYVADFVSLIIDNDSFCGIGYLMTTLSQSFEDHAFSVVDDDCATGYYSFAHEIGHNMGCHHAVGDAGLSQGAGLYNYSHGWRFTASSSTYRTVMAYSPGTRINHFSNPDVNYLGVPTGQDLGESDEAHNALTINNVADTVSNFRSRAPDIAKVSLSGNNIFYFDIEGNLVVEQDLEESATSQQLTQTAGDIWVLKDDSSNVVVRVDSGGDVYLKGTVSENVDPLTPTNQIITFKSDSEAKGFINEDGDLLVAGCVVAWEGGP
jgi:hypothetical protein